MLVTAKFDLHPELPNRKPNGLFSCTDCIYHKNGYIKPCKSFTFKLTNGKSVTWNYNKFFDCDSKDVLYIHNVTISITLINTDSQWMIQRFIRVYTSKHRPSLAWLVM